MLHSPNPKHTTSFQVIFTSEGAVKMYFMEANATAHGKIAQDDRGVFDRLLSDCICMPAIDRSLE